LPGTRAGGPVRSLYSLIEVLKESYSIYLLTSNRDLGSNEEYTGIEADKFIEKENVFYYYFSPGNLNAENIVSLIKEIHPDLIYLNSFWSYNFSIAIVRARKSGGLEIPVLLAPRGMLGSGAMSLKSFKKNIFLLAGKILGWYKNILFHATNEQEKADIQKQFPHAKIFVVSNVSSGKIISNHKSKEWGHLKLFYLSRIARVKNLHFAIDILSQIQADVKIEYDIYGNLEDKEYWKECEALIPQLPANVKVKYCGELQFNEVQTTIAKYHALFLPTLNENFGHSIVESLLCGCPAIISDQTPWNDLQKYRAGYALALDNKKAFNAAITDIAKLKEEEFNEISKAAINYISNKLDPGKITRQYISLFNESIKN
jgi:glycosyltransferase involved in cell wall biosynthesis